MQKTYRLKPLNRYHLASAIDWLILGLLVTGIVLFILYPIYSVIATSFFDKGHFTLRFYKELFTQSNLVLIKNSLWVSN